MDDFVSINLESKLLDFGLLQLNFNVDEIQPADRVRVSSSPGPEESVSDSELDAYFKSLGSLLKKLMEEWEKRKKQDESMRGFLRKGIWASLALEHFGWSNEVALAVVDVFEALHGCYLPKDGLLDTTYLKRFALFLAVQAFAMFPHGSVASTEAKNKAVKWPPAAHAHIEHSPETDPSTQTNLSGRSLLLSALTAETEHRLRFLAANANHFVWIANGAPDRDRETNSPYTLRTQEDVQAAVDALAFVLTASKGSNPCDFKHAVTEAVQSTTKALAVVLSEGIEASLKESQHAATNSVTLTLEAVNKATKVVAPGANEAVSKRTLVIKHCEHSHIYMLNTMENVRIVGCKKATIHLGPVTRTLCVDLCENVTVIAPTNILLLKNSVDCKLYVYTKHRPLFSGDFRGILLGPYCSNYTQLEGQLKSSKLAPVGVVAESENRLWKSPLVLHSVAGSGSGSGSTPEAASQIEICTAAEFQLLPVPLPRDRCHLELLTSMTIQLDPVLLQDQLKRIHQSQSMLEELEHEMEGKGELKGRLIRVVNASFREWLLTSGNMKQVVDLVKLEQAQAQAHAHTPSGHSS